MEANELPQTAVNDSRTEAAFGTPLTQRRSADVLTPAADLSLYNLRRETIAARNREKDPIRTLHQNILDLLRSRDQQPGRDADFIAAIAKQAGYIKAARSQEG